MNKEKMRDAAGAAEGKVETREGVSLKDRGLLSLFGPYVGMVLVFIFFVIITGGTMASSASMRTLLNQNFAPLMLAVGAVFIYAQGYLDFAIGGVSSLSMLLAVIVGNATQNIFLSFLVCMILPLVCYLIVCWLSDSLGVVPMMASLCMMFITQGILQYVTATGVFTLDQDLRIIGSEWYWYLGATAIAVFVGYMLLEHTRFGREIKAIGGNQLAASRTGVNVVRAKYKSYITCALFVGVTSFIYLMRASSVSQSTFSSMHMDIIIIVMLGGMPTRGGAKARVGNAIAGAITMGLLSIGFVIWELNVYYVQLIKGLLFLVVIFFGSRTPKGMPRAK